MFRRSAGHAFWAIADQASFGLSNLCINLLLARWLSPVEYGAFTVAFAMFLLVGAIHTAVFIEPMLVFGGEKFKGRFAEYVGSVTFAHWAITTLLALVVVIAAAAFHAWLPTAHVLIPAVLAFACSPFVLFQWLLRRACYVHLQPRLAAIGGGLYAIIATAGLAVLGTLHMLTVASAFGLMSVASVVVGVWYARMLDVRLVRLPDMRVLRETIGAHAGYGKWSAGTSVLSWIPANLYYFLIPLWAGLEGAGAFRALNNLVFPILHAIVALGPIMLPSFVRLRGRSGFSVAVHYVAGGFVAVALGYWACMLLIGPKLVAWLYAGKYVGFDTVLFALGFLPIPIGLGAVFGAAIRAVEKPDAVFWVYVAATCTSIVLGVTLIPIWGLDGAAFGVVGASMTTALLLGLSFERLVLAGADDRRVASNVSAH